MKLKGPEPHVDISWVGIENAIEMCDIGDFHAQEFSYIKICIDLKKIYKKNKAYLEKNTKILNLEENLHQISLTADYSI